MTQRYPLAWPEGWPRIMAAKRQRARFAMTKNVTQDVRQSDGSTRAHSFKKDVAVSLPRATDRLEAELERLGAKGAILSTNMQLRLDGRPRAESEPPDPGIAVYFTLQGKSRVLASDRWDRVADNIAAVASHIDALRRIDRYGVGTMDQAFRGYDALPPPGATSKRPWRQVLRMEGLSSSIPAIALAGAEASYRTLARERHPDNGGSHEQMTELNAAIAEARKELGAP